MSRAELLPGMEDKIPEEVGQEFVVHGTVPPGFHRVYIDKRGGQLIERDEEGHKNATARLISAVKGIITGRQGQNAA